jgi:hypothetical protein
LTEEKHVADLLIKVGLNNCTTCPMPLSTKDKLSLTDGSPLDPEDNTHYRNIVGALQYLTLIWPDLTFSVNKIC